MLNYKTPYNQSVKVTIVFGSAGLQTTSRSALVTENEKLRAKLAAAEKSAMTDALTNIPNRAFFELYLEQLKSQINHDSDGTGYAVIFVDGDRFKDVNDVHGHPVGDQIIMMIAENLEDAVPEGAVFARIGGEECAVILPNCSKETALIVAERIRVYMEASTYRDKGKNVSLTLSLGVAHSNQTETVLKLADEALYFAKGQNPDHTDTDRNDTRNCVAYFDEAAGTFKVLPRTTTIELSSEECLIQELAEKRRNGISARAWQEGQDIVSPSDLRRERIVERARQDAPRPKASLRLVA